MSPPPSRDPDGGSRTGSDVHPDYPAPCLDPTTVGDAVGRDRRTPGLALRAQPSGRTYSYRDFVTTSYKAGNVLRYLGVRPGDEVQVAAERVPETVLTFYGAAQLGAVTRFGVDDGDVSQADAKVVVAPVDRESGIDLPPGRHLVVYGDPPEQPEVTHWETEVWSENPAIHPVDVAADARVLTAAGRTYTHAALLSAATRARSDLGLDTGAAVAVRGPLTDPAVVATGLLAPILAGGTVVLDAGDDTESGSSIAVDGVGVDPVGPE